MRTIGGTIVVFAFALLLGGARETHATVKTVDIGNFFFSPDSITVSVGDTVRWTHIGTVLHTTTSNTSIWDSGPMSNGDTFEFQFNDPGDFPYHCTFHAATMTGTVTVVDGVTCGDLTQFVARCVSGQTVQARVRATGGWTGTTITISIDGTPHVVNPQVKPDNSASQWKLQVSGVGVGPHTITVDDPAGCFSPFIVDCSTDQPSSWEWEDDASWSASDLDASVAPTATRLLGNYPNPFNPSTAIRYILGEQTNVSLKVFNLLGEEVATLVNGIQKAGEQSVIWNGTNEFGESVSSGLYIYRIQAGDLVMTEKMVLLH